MEHHAASSISISSLRIAVTMSLSAALAISAGSAAYLQAPIAPRAAAAPRADVQMAAEQDGWKAAGLAAALALATGVQSASAGPFTRSEIASLTYDQIKGTGLANTCPKVEAGGASTIKVGGKKGESCHSTRWSCEQKGGAWMGWGIDSGPMW